MSKTHILPIYRHSTTWILFSLEFNHHIFFVSFYTALSFSNITLSWFLLGLISEFSISLLSIFCSEYLWSEESSNFSKYDAFLNIELIFLPCLQNSYTTCCESACLGDSTTIVLCTNLQRSAWYTSLLWYATCNVSATHSNLIFFSELTGTYQPSTVCKCGHSHIYILNRTALGLFRFLSFVCVKDYMATSRANLIFR